MKGWSGNLFALLGLRVTAAAVLQPLCAVLSTFPMSVCRSNLICWLTWAHGVCEVQKKPGRKGSSLFFDLFASTRLDFFWTSIKSIQLLWKYVLDWLLLRSWRLACRNIILLCCILPPSCCADDYSIALGCGILSYMILWMLKTYVGSKADWRN